MRVIAFSDTTAILSDGQTIPLTDWIDTDGDECGPADDFIAAVAGPSQQGEWFTIAVSDYQTATTH